MLFYSDGVPIYSHKIESERTTHRGGITKDRERVSFPFSSTHTPALEAEKGKDLTRLSNFYEQHTVVLVL